MGHGPAQGIPHHGLEPLYIDSTRASVGKRQALSPTRGSATFNNWYKIDDSSKTFLNWYYIYSRLLTSRVM